MQELLLLGKEQRRWLLLLGAALVCILISAFGWLGYRHYRISKNQEAQAVLAEHIERFERAQESPATTAETWNDLAAQLEVAYMAHKSSPLAPFFQVYRAEALMRADGTVLGTTDHSMRALEALKCALETLPHGSVYYYLYAMKHGALLLSRSLVTKEEDGAEARKEGRRALLDLAQDAKNICSILAWYYLWEYAIVAHDEELVAMAMPKLRANTLFASFVADPSAE